MYLIGIDKNKKSTLKSVRFSRMTVIYETWCKEDYDRTPMEIVKLNFKEYSELLQLRCDFKKETSKLIKSCKDEQKSEYTKIQETIYL